MNISERLEVVGGVAEIKEINSGTLKGGHALKKLKSRCDDLQRINIQYQNELTLSEETVKNLSKDLSILKNELYEKINTIGTFKHHDIKEDQLVKSKEETELLLQEEVKTTKKLQLENDLLKTIIKKNVDSYDSLKATIEEKNKVRVMQEKILEEQSNYIKDFENIIKDKDFDIVETQVKVVQLSRENEKMSKTFKVTMERNEYLSNMESTFQSENTQLQTKLKELLEENSLVTINYKAVKRNHDLKRKEFEDLTTELEEAKAACEITIRHKRIVDRELVLMTKEKDEGLEKIRILEAILAKKEKDVSELLTKVNDTIHDYEMKLEKKEEQMWAMSLQVSEENQKAKQQVGVDPDFVSDIEKKCQAKQLLLQSEIERLSQTVSEKEEQISLLNITVNELNSKQFQPRLERLQVLEQDITLKMEQYCLGEEQMESWFLCPRDMRILRKPVTLNPCGHSYCSECMELIKEEHFDKPYCIVCENTTKISSVFYNEQLEQLADLFSKRKELTFGVKTFAKDEYNQGAK